LTPQPQNQVPNRVGIGAPLASASPLPSRNMSNSGSATAKLAPRIIPCSKLRLDHLLIVLFLPTDLQF
jgi:hypothetical protein